MPLVIGPTVGGVRSGSGPVAIGRAVLLLVENLQAAEAVCDTHPKIATAWFAGQPADAVLDICVALARQTGRCAIRVLVSHLAWWGIVHAITHLDAFMFPIAVARPQVQFPVSPQTLGRASVLGASHSLWLLDEPTRAERQRRGLRLAYTEFTNERTALREIQRMPGVGSDLDPEIERRPSRMISTRRTDGRAPHVRRGDRDNRKAARTPAGTAIGAGSERGDGMRAAQSQGMARH